MGKIYRNQTALRFELHTEADLNNALNQKIKFVKPSGETGHWDADVLNATSGYIYYDLTATSDLDEAKTWKFWAWVQFSDGRSAPGESAEVRVFTEGD